MYQPLLKKAIREGLDKNLIVFDSNAKPGEFSLKLPLLMLLIAKEEGIGRLVEFYTSHNPFVENQVEDRDVAVIQEILEFKFYIVGDFDITQYFKDNEGYLAYNDEHLIVAITDEGNVLLGSY